MRKRAWLIILGATAVVAITVWLAWPTPEPTYNGHTLSYWLDTNPQDALERTAHDLQAMEAVSTIGTNALPLLLSRLSREEGPLSGAARSLLARVPPRFWPKWLAEWASPEKAESQANSALDTFSILGPAARPALPALNKMMNNPKAARTTTRRAMCALAYIGKDALPSLLAVLQDTSAPNRPLAAARIGGVSALRTNAGPAIPILIGCLKDKDPELRRSAAEALGWVSLQPELAVPALIESARTSTDTVLRRLSVRALGRFGNDARSAVPYLQAAKSDPWVGMDAGTALLQIAPELLTNAPPP